MDENIIFVGEDEIFILIRMDASEEARLLGGLRELGVEGEATVVYCG